LRISSELPVGVPIASGGPTDLDLEVGEPGHLADAIPDGDLLARFPKQGPFATALVSDAQGFLLRVRGLTDVRYAPDLKRATFLPEPGVGSEHLRELGATVLAVLLSLAGSTVLHGSAVSGVDGLSPEGRAVAVVGAGGAGKSTLAALLCLAGGSFVTDDLLAVTSEGRQVYVRGGCAELRLRSAAGSLLAGLRGYPSRTTVDGRTAILLGTSQRYPVPLHLVLLPVPEDRARAAQVERLKPASAVLRLAGMQRSTGWRLPEVHKAHFCTIVDIANNVPVLEVRWSPSRLQAQDLVAAVKEQLG
jgi:hypothetical protein